MAHLLYEASQGISPEYVQRLLAAFPVSEQDEDTSTKHPGRSIRIDRASE